MATEMTQQEYAAHRQVNASRVSQWINGKGDRPAKITGDALVWRDGKRLIVAEIADRQLGAALHPGQALARPTASAAIPAPARGSEDEHAVRYQKARADSAEIDAERARRRELAERGVYVRAEDARSAWAREIGDFLQALDGAARDIAAAIAAAQAEGPLDERAVTVLLRRELRAFRQRRADLLRSALGALEELVPDAAGEDDDAA